MTHQLEARAQQELDEKRERGAGTRRHVVQRPLDERLPAAAGPEPCEGLGTGQPEEGLNGGAKEPVARDRRRIVGDDVPELHHLARRASGGDQRGVDRAGGRTGERHRSAAEPWVLEELFVDADLKYAASAAARQYEAESPSVSNPHGSRTRALIGGDPSEITEPGRVRKAENRARRRHSGRAGPKGGVVLRSPARASRARA